MTCLELFFYTQETLRDPISLCLAPFFRYHLVPENWILQFTTCFAKLATMEIEHRPAQETLSLTFRASWATFTDIFIWPYNSLPACIFRVLKMALLGFFLPPNAATTIWLMSVKLHQPGTFWRTLYRLSNHAATCLQTLLIVLVQMWLRHHRCHRRRVSYFQTIDPEMRQSKKDAERKWTDEIVGGGKKRNDLERDKWSDEPFDGKKESGKTRFRTKSLPPSLPPSPSFSFPLPPSLSLTFSLSL